MSHGFARSTPLSETIYRSGTEIDVVNSATETTILTTTIPAATLSTNRALRITIVGDYFNNSGASRIFTAALKLGGTTIAEDATTTLAASVTRRPFVIEASIGNLESASAQVSRLTLNIGAASAATVGVGNFASGAADAVLNTVVGTGTVNTAVDVALVVTVTHPAADANLSVKMKHVSVILI
jgi:hypothetical protein